MNAWLWGTDATPGIVSVWASLAGEALVFRRVDGQLLREAERFRPWLVTSSLDDVLHLGGRLRHERDAHTPDSVGFQELSGPGSLRFVLRADDGVMLQRELARGATRRLGHTVNQLRELGQENVLVLPPEEQYLVQSGRTYFRGMSFDMLRRLQFDLETTGLNPDRDRIFLIAVRTPEGELEVLEADSVDDAGEASLIARLVQTIRRHDPDVIENHNLHGFDLPFVARRASTLGVPLGLGRFGPARLERRPAARGERFESSPGSEPTRPNRLRYSIVGRECIDSMDAVRRHDFAARDLPGHGLKAVARHFGLASAQRELIPGALVYDTYLRDPERVRRYAGEDVHEAAALARLLGGSSFALAQMVPRRYERLADTGAATGIVDPLLVRAYLQEGAALPSHEHSDGTPHSGAALHLFATGVAHRVVKADVASLYPSLIRAYRIGPARDHLGVFLAVVDDLVTLRLAAKARAQEKPRGSVERFSEEALSAAMKLVVNSAYGYLGAAGLTRFSDVHAANEVTRHGRTLLDQLCRELARRGVSLLEADTDGVYFAVPDHFDEADEQRVVSEVAQLLPEKVKLEFEGRYAAMLSHEPKNYALLGYDGVLSLRGVAFRSRRAEPFGEAFLRDALACLLRDDVQGVRDAFLRTSDALKRRALPTLRVATQVRLTKTPAQYMQSRGARRELAYEALLAADRREWQLGERVHVYRGTGKRALSIPREAIDDPARADALPHDYDVPYYLRLLQETFASRLVTALSREDYAAVFADAQQLSLFAPSLANVRPILTKL